MRGDGEAAMAARDAAATTRVALLRRRGGDERATNAPAPACVDYEFVWGVVERWSTSSETGDEATRTACEAAIAPCLSSVVRQERASRARRVRERARDGREETSRR